MKRSIFVVGASVALASALSAGCDVPSDEDVNSGARAPEIYQVGLELQTAAALPTCNAARAGTTAYVASPSGVWRCVASVWLPILCTNLNAGSVAYASASQTLWGCVAGAWTQISLPPGPPGAPGPAGTPTLLKTTPESAGANCAAGGQRIDVGPDTNRNGVLDAAEVEHTTYVCNGIGSPETCAPGQVLCGAACVDLATSSANCGACGHSCGGETCSAGRCAVTTLASPGSWSQGIVVDDTYVYFTHPSGARVGRVAKIGGGVDYIPVGSSPQGLVIGGGNLYVANQGSDDVSVIDLGIATVTATIPVGDGVQRLAFRDHFVYATNKTAGTLSVIDTDTNTVVSTVSASGEPSAIATDSIGVWWVTRDNQFVHRGQLGTAVEATIRVSEGAHPQGIAVDDTWVYVTATNGTIDHGSLWRYPRTGIADSVLLASDQAGAFSPIVSGDSLYWTNPNDGSHAVMKMVRPAGPPVIVAAGFSPNEVAADASHVYFTSISGVHRVAK